MGAGRKAWRKPPRSACFPITMSFALCLLIVVLVVTGAPAAASPPDAEQGHPSQAFLMSFAAGSSTGLGALLVLCVTRLSPRLLAITMSFSAGVMIYVSMVAVVQESYLHFRHDHAEPLAYALATLSFFAGAVLMALTDDVVHVLFDSLLGDARQRRKPLRRGGGRAAEIELGDADLLDDSDEEALAIESVIAKGDKSDVLRMSAVLGIAIALHNLPEGMATYVASYHSVNTGAPLTIAIAIHNIPEGLAVAMPILHGTGSRTRAIFWASLSGMAEPLGALLAYIFVNPKTSQSSFGAMFAVSAGMMVYVCLSELLPAAYREHPSPKLVTRAFFAGCLVMASSLVLEKFNAEPPLSD
ncbi:Zinc/iron permease [Pavlovales sp. CCMP2436]|nr:Zinc/iron permease [Pavlovales sp. CCMP2436]